MNKMTKEEKRKALLLSREKALERFKKIQKRMREEEEDSEQVYPGHDSTRYHYKMIEYETLLAHLAEIEKELKELGR